MYSAESGLLVLIAFALAQVCYADPVYCIFGSVQSGKCVCDNVNRPPAGYIGNVTYLGLACDIGLAVPTGNSIYQFSAAPDGRNLSKTFFDGTEVEPYYNSNCSQIFPPNVVSKLGIGPSCDYTCNMGSNSLLACNVRITNQGTGATLPLGYIFPFNFRLHSPWGYSQFFNVTIGVPYFPTLSFAAIQGPRYIGACENLTLIAYGDDASSRDLDFSWNVNCDSPNAGLTTLVITNLGRNLIVPNNTFSGMYICTFTVTGTNWVGGTAQGTLPVKIYGAMYVPLPAVPQLTGPNPFLISIYQSQSLSINGYLSNTGYCNSLFPPTPSVPSWTVSMGNTTYTLQSNSTGSVFIHSYELLSDNIGLTYKEYNLTFSSQLTSDGSINSATILLRVYRSLLRGVIQDGKGTYVTNSTVVVDANKPYVLNASSSYDPDHQYPLEYGYSWDCSPSCPFNVTNITGPALSIPASQMLVGVYTVFSTFFTIFRGVPTPYPKIKSFVNLHVTQSSALILSKDLSGPVPNGSPLMIFSSLYTLDGSIITTTQNGASYNWTVSGGDISTNTKLQSIITAMNASLYIPSNVLNGPSVYTFQLTVTYASQRWVGNLTFSVILPQPSGGICTITPTIGTTYLTTFMFNCSGWIVKSQARYSFGYYTQLGNMVSLLSNSSSSLFSTMSLPIGYGSTSTLPVYATITDVIGTFTTVNLSVIVQVPTQANANTTSYSSSVEVANLVLQNYTSTLQSVVSSGDTSAATTLIQTITQVINGPTTALLTSSGSTCPNSCSGNGVCSLKNGLCQCNSNYGGLDCSLTAAEVAVVQTARTNLLTTLSTVINETTQITTSSVEQSASILSSLTSNSAEINSAGQSIALTVASTLTNTLQQYYSVSSVQSVCQALSNVVSSTYASLSVTPTAKSSVINNAYTTITTMTNIVVTSMNTGDAPTVVSTPQYSIAAYRNYASALAGTTIVTSNYTSQISITLPTSFSTNTSSSVFAASDELFVTASSLTANPYLTYSSSQNLSSTVLSLNFKSHTTGQKVAVSGLLNPIYFTLQVPGGMNTSLLQSNASLSGIRPSCKYWNVTMNSWSTDGCEMVGYTSTSITCACTHTTDFAAFVEPYIPSKYITCFYCNTFRFEYLVSF
jgi:hypothetical protein